MNAKLRKVLWIGLAVIAISAVCTGGWLGWKFALKPWLFPPSPLVFTPQVGLQRLQAKSLYYSGDAYRWLSDLRPDLLHEDDRDPKSGRVAGFAQATQQPSLFRQLDREYRFDTLVLLGDPSGFQRLLDHLIEPEPEKRDFRLVYLDHWMFVFKRGAPREWQFADLDLVKAELASLHFEDRARFKAKVAERMMAVGYKEPGKKLLEEALRDDSDSQDALAGMAGYYALLAKWPETESYADRALAIQPDFAPALQRKIVALLGTKHTIDAFKYSQQLLKVIPETPSLLRQHANVAHLAGKYDAEIAALSKVILMAEAENRPAGEYHFALGEAHTLAAKADAVHAPRAAEHFKKALRDPSLPAEMKKFAIERLKTISERTGIK